MCNHVHSFRKSREDGGQLLIFVKVPLSYNGKLVTLCGSCLAGKDDVRAWELQNLEMMGVVPLPHLQTDD